MRKAAQALSGGAHAVGKYFADINPDHGALGERKERDVADQQVHKDRMRCLPEIGQASAPARATLAGSLLVGETSEMETPLISRIL